MHKFNFNQYGGSSLCLGLVLNLLVLALNLALVVIEQRAVAQPVLHQPLGLLFAYAVDDRLGGDLVLQPLVRILLLLDLGIMEFMLGCVTCSDPLHEADSFEGLRLEEKVDAVLVRGLGLERLEDDLAQGPAYVELSTDVFVEFSVH